MTSHQARVTANVILATAGLAAAYVVVTTPPLRRVAWRAARIWMGGSVPVVLLTMLGRAWAESAPPR
jgi:hypothetical protein